MITCDNCGKPMQQMDDDSLYCPYCGHEADNSWVAFVPDSDFYEI